jgi:hypothetical protein
LQQDVVVGMPAAVILQCDLKERGSTDDVCGPDGASAEGPQAQVEAPKLVLERIVRVLEGEGQEADRGVLQELDDVLTDDAAPVPGTWKAETVPTGGAHHAVAIRFSDVATQKSSEATAVKGQDAGDGLPSSLESLGNPPASVGPSGVTKDRGDLF